MVHASHGAALHAILDNSLRKLANNNHALSEAARRRLHRRLRVGQQRSNKQAEHASQLGALSQSQRHVTRVGQRRARGEKTYRPVNRYHQAVTLLLIFAVQHVAQVDQPESNLNMNHEMLEFVLADVISGDVARLHDSLDTK